MCIYMLGKETEKSKNRSWRGKTKHQARTFRGLPAHVPSLNVIQQFQRLNLVNVIELCFPKLIFLVQLLYTIAKFVDLRV